ncbi:hypothetical protein HOB87_00410 [Candidatus Woesearchaeota archaeon]|jgi:hypothetical protein|nr:hypothetical protein [Candidatus Woesearchaeota archaeon]MBT7558835.1 hypothetical protein [Candidatus Woesearchaeota archaeon]
MLELLLILLVLSILVVFVDLGGLDLLGLAIMQTLDFLKSLATWLYFSNTLVFIAYTIILLTLIIAIAGYYLDNSKKPKNKTLKERPFAEARFEEKIKEFGWDKSNTNSLDSSNTPLENDKRNISFENIQLLDFIDKYIDITSISTAFNSYSFYQINKLSNKTLNKKLISFFEGCGLYDFEINQYIVNGSEATRMAMLDRIDRNFLKSHRY